ncbi:hypothetical protein [Burkholderia gladioli]|uniref:hypothetical protein n=1 Tax=Burkholderia gladioli TaxID=28095 RepID=UPI00163F418B|nr:hypothetical protein [Burkholderia gladioli]
MLAVLIAITSCAACALLASTGRAAGRTLGLLAALLWFFAGLAGGIHSVVKVAAFCAACFALPLIRSAFRRLHV